MNNRVYIFDTTLRDGEQSPGCSMNFEEKIRMARQLERLQVDVIEAGFPVASEGDFESVREIAKQVRGCSVAALSRATETTEDDPAIGVRDLTARGFTGRDVLVGIAASGRTPYVLGAVAEARRLGAVTVGISCTPNSALAGAVDIAITPLVGPEVVAGSTRMKSGTAQKLVLNMLSTGAFIRLGYVYGNLMVNVQPKNTKLVDRARRIVAQAVGVSYARAGELLAAAGNSVRAAILMAKTGVDRAEAERRLAEAGGRISKALAEARGKF